MVWWALWWWGGTAVGPIKTHMLSITKFWRGRKDGFPLQLYVRCKLHPTIHILVENMIVSAILSIAQYLSLHNKSNNHIPSGNKPAFGAITSTVRPKSSKMPKPARSARSYGAPSPPAAQSTPPLRKMRP